MTILRPGTRRFIIRPGTASYFPTYIPLCTPSRLVGCAGYSLLHEGEALANFQCHALIHFVHIIACLHFTLQGHHIREHIQRDPHFCGIARLHVCPWLIRRWRYRWIHYLLIMCVCMKFHTYLIASFINSIHCFCILSTMINISRGSNNDIVDCLLFAIKRHSFIDVCCCSFHSRWQVLLVQLVESIDTEWQ